MISIKYWHIPTIFSLASYGVIHGTNLYLVTKHLICALGTVHSLQSAVADD